MVYDDDCLSEDLACGAGFASVVTVGDRVLLFDTGGDGEALLSNLARLGTDPADIDLVLISHNHSDHVGGLPQLGERWARPELFLLEGLPENLTGRAPELVGGILERAREQASQVVTVSGPTQVSRHIHSTGPVGTRIPEQALVIRTERGLIVITGCAHPGVGILARRARELFDQEVLLVMGGFHLDGRDQTEIEAVVSELRQLTTYISPCHCSGDAARELFRQGFEGQYIECAAGVTINPGELGGELSSGAESPGHRQSTHRRGSRASLGNSRPAGTAGGHPHPLLSRTRITPRPDTGTGRAAREP